MRSEVLPTVDEVGYWRGRTTGLRAGGETFVQDCVVSATEQRTTICAVQDVSAEAEEDEQLNRYQALIEVLKDPVYVLDEGGQFDFVNNAFVEKFGFQREELLGNSVSTIKNEQAVEQGLNNLRQILSSDGPDSTYFETEIKSQSGESIPCEDHMTALPYEGDAFDGSVGILRDVSRQKERERELRRQNRRLDAFASVVSHDLRNPLNVAEGNVELLREECDSDRIDRIEQSLVRMSELIDDLLQLSRVGNDTDGMESVSLAEESKSCWQRVETGDATLQTKADRTVRADPSRLVQLFENLMRNAVEHTSQDVTVTVGELEDGFYVEDDGSGIPEDSRDDVFEAGYTTTDEGTGFGLSIVKDVAEAHGWEVSITEGSEGGARFGITNVDFETS
ncbi:two-component system sensor histidine kinase NtrB [Halobellus ruber]|uniref:two-component system sensor histidine kinase NtrB n=1 Tax=Halobellus ruber TaxID=2761102 RepID=UPI001FE30D5B|nr:PAS domain-containing sensor histidine kinase [Halobellus ruber]